MLVKWYIVNAVMLLLITKGSARTSKVLDAPNEQVDEKQLAKELEEAVQDLKLAEKLEQETNSTRDSRGLLKKLSFLAGVKVGNLLQSSGTLAASNSIRVFGKVLNTALSVSYGNADEIEELPEIHRPGFSGSEVVKPTLHDHESSKPTAVAESGSEGTEDKVKEGFIEIEHPPMTRLQSIRQNFLKNHNTYVTRVNNKFLKDGSMARFV